MYRLRRIRPSSIVLLVVVLGLAAALVHWLSSDGPSGSAAAPALTPAGRPYADALEERLTHPGPMWAGFSGLTPEQATCVAAPWVMTVGPERLAAAGVQPDEFGKDPAGGSAAAGITWDQANQVLSTYQRCGLEANELIARAEIVMYDGLGRKVSVQVMVRCMADKLDERAADRVFVLSLTEPTLGERAPAVPGFATPPTVDPDVNRELVNAAAACA